MTEIELFISQQKYRQAQHSHNPDIQTLICEWLNQSPPSSDFFKEVAQLTKFYGIAFLYCLREVYNQLDAEQRKAFEKELQLIMMVAKDLLKDDVPQELAFLFKVDGVRERVTVLPHQFTEREVKFLEYWRKVRKAVKNIESIPMEKVSVLGQAFSDFFELAGDMELTVIEQTAIDVYTQKVYFLYEKVSNTQRPTSSHSTDGYASLTPRQNISDNIAQPPSKPFSPDQQQTQRIPLCCRKFFYKDQILDEPQSLTLQYKDYSYPWSPHLGHILKKTICGFLNRSGGILLIGVTQDRQTKRPVVNGGRIYSQAVRQQIDMDLMSLAKTISPNIISNLKVSAKFVPVKSYATKQFIPGAYVIRVVVECGERDAIYFFSENEVDFYCFRTQKEVLRVKTMDAWEEFKNRLRKPMEKAPKLYHEGVCVEPDLGKPIYRDKNQNKNQRNKPKQQEYQEQRVFQASNSQKQFKPRYEVQQKQQQPEPPAPKQHQPQPPAPKQQPQPIAPKPQHPFTPKQQQHQPAPAPPQAKPQHQNKPHAQTQPSQDKDLLTLLVINIPVDQRNHRKYINKVISNLHTPDIVASKQAPQTIGLKIQKEDLSQLKCNVGNLKATVPQANQTTILYPLQLIELTDDSADQSLLKVAGEFVKKKVGINAKIDLGQKILRFQNIDDATKGYLLLQIQGFKPKFAKR